MKQNKAKQNETKQSNNSNNAYTYTVKRISIKVLSTMTNWNRRGAQAVSCILYMHALFILQQQKTTNFSKNFAKATIYVMYQVCVRVCVVYYVVV